MDLWPGHLKLSRSALSLGQEIFIFHSSTNSIKVYPDIQKTPRFVVVASLSEWRYTNISMTEHSAYSIPKIQSFSFNAASTD